jgi:hypothetical protein
MVIFRRLLTKWLEGACTIKVDDGTIRLDYLNIKDMLADMLTKLLQKAEHARFTALLGLRRRQN